MVMTAENIAATACQQSHEASGLFMASPYDCALRAARIALETLGPQAENRLIDKMRIESGIYRLRAEAYTSDAINRIIKEFLEEAGSTPPPAPHVMGAIAAFEAAHPEHYWHVAKGKVTAGEPLYGAIITDIIGRELGHGESNESAEAAFAIAVTAAGLATTEGADNG